MLHDLQVEENHERDLLHRFITHFHAYFMHVIHTENYDIHLLPYFLSIVD